MPWNARWRPTTHVGPNNNHESPPMSSTATILVSRHFPYPAERVFDAWLDPALAARFLFATDAGVNVKAEIDPRVGGTYVIVDRRDGEDIEHTGEYLEIVRPTRLVFTLQVPKYSREIDRIQIDIKPMSEGCELTLLHETDLSSLAFKDKIEHGWNSILSGLDRAVSSSAPGTHQDSNSQ